MISSMAYKPMKTKKYKNTFLIERLSSLKISKLIKNIKNRPILNQISKSVPTDLRSGASLLIAGLIAEGTTVIENSEQIFRGYSNIVNKLQNVGAKIEITE